MPSLSCYNFTHCLSRPVEESGGQRLYNIAFIPYCVLTFKGPYELLTFMFHYHTHKCSAYLCAATVPSDTNTTKGASLSQSCTVLSRPCPITQNQIRCYLQIICIITNETTLAMTTGWTGVLRQTLAVWMINC